MAHNLPIQSYVSYERVYIVSPEKERSFLFKPVSFQILGKPPPRQTLQCYKCNNFHSWVRSCLETSKIGVLTYVLVLPPGCVFLFSNSQFLQIVKPTWREKTSKFTILAASDTSLKKKPANAQLARILKLSRRRKSLFCRILILFFWILQLWFLSTKKTIWWKCFYWRKKSERVPPVLLCHCQCSVMFFTIPAV